MRTRQEIETELTAMVRGNIAPMSIVTELLLDLRDQGEQALALNREAQAAWHALVAIDQARVENERDAMLVSAGIQSGS